MEPAYRRAEAAAARTSLLLLSKSHRNLLYKEVASSVRPARGALHCGHTHSALRRGRTPPSPEGAPETRGNSRLKRACPVSVQCTWKETPGLVLREGTRIALRKVFAKLQVFCWPDACKSGLRVSPRRPAPFLLFPAWSFGRDSLSLTPRLPSNLPQRRLRGEPAPQATAGLTQQNCKQKR